MIFEKLDLDAWLDRLSISIYEMAERSFIRSPNLSEFMSTQAWIKQMLNR